MRECAICAKKLAFARRLNKLRGKFNPTPTKRKQKPNLQWVKTANGPRILACSKCIKSLAKVK